MNRRSFLKGLTLSPLLGLVGVGEVEEDLLDDWPGSMFVDIAEKDIYTEWVTHYWRDSDIFSVSENEAEAIEAKDIDPNRFYRVKDPDYPPRFDQFGVHRSDKFRHDYRKQLALDCQKDLEDKIVRSVGLMS